MNFQLTEERQMLQDSLRRYLADTVSPEMLAEATESEAGHSETLWSGLAEMGVIGALFSEHDGGFGGAGFDLAVVFEETGRAGAFEPLVASGVLAGGLIAARGSEAQKARVEDIIGGAILGFAHSEPGARYDLDHVETKATKDGAGWRLDGRKTVVEHAGAAEAFVVSARTGGETRDAEGISLFLVPADAPGLTTRDYPLNGGGRAGEVTLEGVSLPGDALIGAEGDAFPAIEEAAARATCAICAEALGLMESIRALTVDYLKQRKQFGQPIGKFQALQHRMADVLIEIEQARSAVINLAGHLAADRVTRERHVSATKNLIGRAGRLVVEEAIQLHGGIGMTEEYALGHLAKRLTMVDHRFGDTDHHLERFIRLSAA
ncbi:acyl-CoA dehydrogenase [Roseivivax halodurans JCM 10272]|uniref:Acyl-CoA dehydrogenase n=1 Tax=Roseivivax halodurans JCM 10272 TaxID=1449350 RepID=X7EA85_9RHOB|nr:acyl-CoA dehydrogenase [Roseivivax halodurans]ETX12979.1 acyl-CoA dehydrogenase [Roseivivax halodurans JCM 10272]